MTKNIFLIALRHKMKGLPKKEIEERIVFYNEMIDDLMEEGLSEDEAIAKIGSTDEVASEISSDTELELMPINKNASRFAFTPLNISLIILAAPLWIPLVAVAFSLVISILAVMFSLIASFWAITLAFALAAPASILFGLIYLFNTCIFEGILLISAALLLAGLSILCFLGCKSLTLKFADLIKCISQKTKRRFKKEVL